MSIDRKLVLRNDCPDCGGKGYKNGQAGEELCDRCEGVGMLEKWVPYQVDPFEPSEIARIFEIPESQVKDSGHSTGEDQ